MSGEADGVYYITKGKAVTTRGMKKEIISYILTEAQLGAEHSTRRIAKN